HLNLSPAHRTLPPFPTRRSSDLAGALVGLAAAAVVGAAAGALVGDAAGAEHAASSPLMPRPIPRTRVTISRRVRPWRTCASAGRSEEHTSELQSRENLVCRLLLE